MLAFSNTCLKNHYPHVYACIAGDPRSISGLGKSPGEGNGCTLQYSHLKQVFLPVAWWATVHGVTKSWTKLSNYHVHFHFVPSKYHKPISNWTSDHPLHGGNLLPVVFLVTEKGNFILPAVLSVLIPLFLWTPHINGQQTLSDPSLKYVQSLPPASHTPRDSELHPSPYCLPPGCYSSLPATWAPAVCSQHVSRRELLIEEIRICHSSTSHTQGFSSDLRVKAEVTTVASKYCPTQTSPSLHSSASVLVSSILLILQPSLSGCSAPWHWLFPGPRMLFHVTCYPTSPWMLIQISPSPRGPPDHCFQNSTLRLPWWSSG